MSHSLPESADLWNSAVAVLGRSLSAPPTSWDVAVTAVGLAYVNPTRAWRDLRHLFEGQWPDGRLAHNGAGLVRPPLQAIAAWEVYRRAASHGAVCAYEAGAELAWLYPRLVAQQEFLTRGRDAGGAGLASIVHPWESGLGDSPAWNADPAPRPGFAVECPAFNAILAAAELALVHLAAVVGADPTEHRRRARKITDAVATRLYDGRTRSFHCRDARTGVLRPASGVDGLMPLLLPDLPREQVEAIMAQAGSPPGAETIRIDVTWLLRRGMLVHGYLGAAEELRTAMIRLVHRGGLHESFHPSTGEGVGAPASVPAAALSLDLLTDRSVPAYARAA
ncbi:MGH1-like glycoside hydrolase domain-containing protein [Couchioplanes caeruleus]|uniref:Mannosylglycerate hydrolase MGH1-like glycoside hydrolase domain-containing protein n=2 Tax=Couchioplanes caeruleus TaxID=56438 RepID=A0A1K0FL19_9ACTN|nr:hypothetical protein [Couchioplanes caeruleus]OJF13424.1 hypothetical protein BG844_15295 [Couchioplanes caeruleus subsp. caeruleus]ROP29910.1 hypothetical protein EDD30_2736 [Couchioplanes caeruleus]